MPAADRTPGSVCTRASTRSSVADGCGLNLDVRPTPPHPGRARELSWRHAKVERHQPLAVKVRVTRGQAREAGREERSSEEEHEGDGNLAGDDRASPGTCCRPRGAACRMLLNGLFSVSRELRSAGTTPKTRAVITASAAVHRQQPRIDRHRRDGGLSGQRCHHSEGPQAHPGDEQAETAAHDRQQQALGQQLPDNPATARAERQAQRELWTSHGATSQ